MTLLRGYWKNADCVAVHQLAESWKEKYWYMGGMVSITTLCYQGRID